MLKCVLFSKNCAYAGMWYLLNMLILLIEFSWTTNLLNLNVMVCDRARKEMMVSKILNDLGTQRLLLSCRVWYCLFISRPATPANFGCHAINSYKFRSIFRDSCDNFHLSNCTWFAFSFLYWVKEIPSAVAVKLAWVACMWDIGLEL